MCIQVKPECGEWMAVPYVPDTVTLIVGKLMQRWTSDRLKAIVSSTYSDSLGVGKSPL